jgi:hypothetical protein
MLHCATARVAVATTTRAATLAVRRSAFDIAGYIGSMLLGWERPMAGRLRA